MTPQMAMPARAYHARARRRYVLACLLRLPLRLAYLLLREAARTIYYTLIGACLGTLLLLLLAAWGL